MGLTNSERAPKPSFGAVQKMFGAAPYFPLSRAPKVSVVVASYNAERTLRACLDSLERLHYPDCEIILVDDLSRNHKFEIAKKMGLHAIRHPQNRGYGGNPRIWYQEAPKLGASVVVMLNRDCRYTPKFVVGRASMIATGQYAASRILCRSAICGGVPVYARQQEK